MPEWRFVFFFKFCDGRNKRISNVIRCNAFNLTNCNWILISWMFYVIFAFGSMGKEGQKTKKKNNNNVIVKRSLFIAIFTYLSYWWWFTSKTYDLGAFLYISLTCKCICVWHNMVIHFTSAVFFCARPDSIFIHTQFHWYYEENPTGTVQFIEWEKTYFSNEIHELFKIEIDISRLFAMWRIEWYLSIFDKMLQLQTIHQ